MSDQAREAPDANQFAPRCLSIDLEVGIQDARVHSFAAVRGDDGRSLVYSKGNLTAALAQLDTFAEGCSFLLGHNLIAFDAPHLAAVKPDLRLLRLPMVDTLRLNPLAFPRNPYHHLVKHYQDGQLKRGRLNDPELDARLTLDVFRNQYQAFRSLNDITPDLLLAWHWLTTMSDGTTPGLGAFFMTLRRQPRPTATTTQAAIERLLRDRACSTHGRAMVADAEKQGWALAYALAWLSVAGGNSVMPPWVRHQFPEAGLLVRRLRDTACDDPACGWCRERHDARKELNCWFGFSEFRPEPVGHDGRPLQQTIVEATMGGKHVLGILPTGTGKSLCYQIPALSRYDKIGALTVVISPLVALMADQVTGLEARGITACAALNGLLSMPERADVLNRVRLGDIGILIVSPEQLRNRAFRRVLAQREIGAWVLDEAHCLSKWGHDFRPDYRYVGRFIQEKAGAETIPPILCLTATAKPDVMADIVGYFRDKLGIELTVFDGGTRRANLNFAVVPTSPGEKFAHIHQILLEDLPADGSGGAIVYCATRRQAEEVAAFLREKELAAAHFHAGLPPETKKGVQKRFIDGESRVIVATNAFGMGIDKPDVRLVIHADIPGSLENYLQEAGRAGRDRRMARCVLLYTPEDVERQFGMSARSRLTQREIRAILKALRNLDRKKRFGGEVVATAGEILAEEEEGAFERDSTTDDTRVRTAIAWLEEAALLSREENQVQVFPSSLRVSSMEEAQKRLTKALMIPEYRRQLLALVEALMAADADQGISTDELMGVSGLSAEKLRAALYDLERLSIASNDTALTAFVHTGVEHSSRKHLQEATALETTLIAELRESAPDLGKGETSLLHLRQSTQRLKDAGLTNALPEKLWRIAKGIAADGRGEDGGGSLRLRRLDAETIEVKLQREWQALAKTAQLRRMAADRLLEHLLACLPPGTRGTDLLAETTLGKLLAAVEGDLALKAEIKDPPKLLDRALLWLHEQEVIRLNKGLAVFRPAMTIRLGQDKRSFVKADFTPLKLHYDEQVVQIHVMAEYVQRGLRAMADALRLTMDYFSLNRTEFIKRWLPGRDKELSRQTLPESWQSIVESLNNPLQQRIVADDREQTNALVLAGPGSGKTRVLVHRIAYLVRARRENPRGILALSYNRHAAVEIRRRLHQLIGDDAKGVTVLTCHALAMRLAGASFAGRAATMDGDAFDAVLRQAVALLQGVGLPPEEADMQRERLLAGFRWILVDEYQDIGSGQYELISALAGRTLQDEDGRLSLFAVGDDDQNIYAFDGASVEFIRRFETDYAAKSAFLIENYRSTTHIITVANLMIASARNRMKAEHAITIDRARSKAPAGGDWQAIDPVGKGRVQILSAGMDSIAQAVATMIELQRLATLDPNWDWSRTAVIAREWKFLEPIRSYCELNGIPVQMADEDTTQFWRLREIQSLVEWLRTKAPRLVDAGAIERWLDERPNGPWWGLLREAIQEYALETGGAELPVGHLTEWLAEWGREVRRRQTGLMLLTAHRAKGLEFDHVAVLDGGWNKIGHNEDPDAPRRLYYVAMTRAKKTLLLARFDRGHPLLDALPANSSLLRRPSIELPAPSPALTHRHQRPTLKDIDIGFAGRHAPMHGVHRAITALVAGDALTLFWQQEHKRWLLADGQGNTVGRLARAFTPPSGMRCVEARVIAILIRRKEDAEPEYQASVRCDRWEVVVPELVFEPEL
ncbi:MAG TPA: RecQ family ATP-dependent DNA helicase [Candidatus Competibacter sp.]|nr:RecQ family ATP-dependent DNA helicase [Candidatus Competibacteraceae bacterium]HPE71368.1 RecQ family ATP-dependent DNA helicase [Candidatus Competibacter sp.]HRW66983.1 RecQ family ATP-dependent DNA helicase [Candidatus Competibacter sp.]